MGKLLERLKDASRSGVYRVRADAPVLEALGEAGVSAVKIVLGGAATKADVLQRIARTLEFPDWFGGNWDALEDSLGDLSWRKGAGHVLVFTTYPTGDERGVLTDVLRSSA